MTMKHPIEAISLPGDRTISPYSDDVRMGDLLFLSRRIGLDHNDMTLLEGAAQTRQCVANISEVLALAGSSLDRVKKATAASIVRGWLL